MSNLWANWYLFSLAYYLVAFIASHGISTFPQLSNVGSDEYPGCSSYLRLLLRCFYMGGSGIMILRRGRAEVWIAFILWGTLLMLSFVYTFSWRFSEKFTPCRRGFMRRRNGVSTFQVFDAEKKVCSRIYVMVEDYDNLGWSISFPILIWWDKEKHL